MSGGHLDAKIAVIGTAIERASKQVRWEDRVSSVATWFWPMGKASLVRVSCFRSCDMLFANFEYALCCHGKPAPAEQLAGVAMCLRLKQA